MLDDDRPDPQIEAVRRFNRLYTQKIGVLEDRRLYAPFSLAETRVLYELAHRERATASDLCRDLGLDAGYLSRLLRGLERQGLIARRPAETDGRQSLLSLTQAGRSSFGPLEDASRRVLGDLLGGLTEPERTELVAAMGTIETLLGGAARSRAPYLMRSHRPGDIGWVVGRHGAIYAEEYGWDETFEALVAEIAAAFLREHDPAREHCWIAEIDGSPVGSVFLVRESDAVAKLRLLIVEPRARGHGIGARLVEECIRFARRAGYRRITLWTNSVLMAARAIYVKAGFRLIESAPHRSFGKDLVGENWELALS